MFFDFISNISHCYDNVPTNNPHGLKIGHEFTDMVTSGLPGDTSGHAVIIAVVGAG